jgi:hypothetical protein
MKTSDVYRVRIGALSLVISGILFVLYPAIRPFSDEKSLQGAEAFASNAWILAHVLAMLAFILLTLGMLALHIRLQGTSVERLAFRMLVVCWLGIGLTLPFYGAEAFGLHSIGKEALRQQSPAFISVANDVRTGPGLPIFILGLALLAIGAIMAAFTVWKTPGFLKWSGIPLALGFVLYIPQFAGTQPIRIVHGAVIAVGCLLIALNMWRKSENQDHINPNNSQ